MTTNEKRWQVCSAWFDSKPNVKKCFINAFATICVDNVFDVMHNYCREGVMYRSIDRLIDSLPNSCNKNYLFHIWGEVKSHCRSTGY